MPSTYETPWHVNRYRQRLADLLAILRRAAKYRCEVDPHAIACEFPFRDASAVREFAAKHGLSRAVDDGRALIRKNFPGIDNAPGPIDRTHGGSIK